MAIEDLNKVVKFLKSLQSDIFSRRGMSSVGELAKDVIFKRTKSGFGVNNDRIISPAKVRLRPLSASYIIQRRKRGVRGAFGSAGTSNLTNTGNLLDSMVVSARVGSVTIEIPNTRRRDGKINKDIARFVAINGRPFFALTRDEQTIVRRDIETRIRKTFNKFF